MFEVLESRTEVAESAVPKVFWICELLVFAKELHSQWLLYSHVSRRGLFAYSCSLGVDAMRTANIIVLVFEGCFFAETS